MKYFVGIMLTFAALLTFLPSHYSNGIRNLPLLIAILSVFAGYHIIRAVRRTAALIKIRKHLVSEKMRIKHFCLVPNLLGIKNKYDIVAEDRSHTVNIVLLMRKRKGLRYHFERPDLLEYYTGFRSSIRATRYGASRVSIAQANGYDSTSLAGRRKLPFQDEAVKGESNIIIIDRLPRCVTDSVSRHELSSGDTICGYLRLYIMKR